MNKYTLDRFQSFLRSTKPNGWRIGKITLILVKAAQRVQPQQQHRRPAAQQRPLLLQPVLDHRLLQVQSQH